MTLSPAFLDELRARTPLSTLVGKSVKLTKAGREYKACCPFHHEKTPSFYVNDEKGFYHCFGCQAHGDAIRFLTDARGLPFMDAVKELADAAGMELPAPDPQARARAERAVTLYDAIDAAQRFFEEQLDGLEGGEARAYLQKRGISEDTRRRFGFGFAPDSRGKLKTALKDYGNDRLVEAGLLVQPDEDKGRGTEPYDRFRGRLTFPIRDRRGRVIAFSARILGAGEPKYLNSPETPIFDKGRTLFNIDIAAAAARTAGRVIVVEGQMDVIALAQAGIGEAVAPLGTALTEMQLALLWQMAPSPIICFDGDNAGQKAAVRGALRALPHLAPGRSLSFATLPPGQDPDDLIKARGRDAIETLLAKPENLVDRLWRHEREAEPLDTPEQRAGLKRRLLDHTSTIGDPDVRDQYRAELLRRYDAIARPPRAPFQPNRPWTPGKGGNRFQPPPRPTSDEARAVGSGGLNPALARSVLVGLINHPDLIAAHSEAVAALPIAARDLRRLRDLLLDAAFAHSSLDRATLVTILTGNGAPPLDEGAGQTRGLAFSFTRANAEPERAQRDLVLVVDTLAQQPELRAALASATARLEDDGDDAAFAEQVRLRTELEETDRRIAGLILDE